MKKILFVTLVLTLTLSACSSNTSESAQPSVDQRPAQGQPPTDGQAPAQGQPPVGGPPSGEAPAQGQPPAGEQPSGSDASSAQSFAQAQPAMGGQPSPGGTTAYAIVDTGQANCYDTSSESPCPQEGQTFYGQDAQYQGLQPAYRDNGDGTVTDLNTGLTWQQTPDLENKSTYPGAVAGAATFNLAGCDDWRLPTLKELYSLIDFNGSQFTKTPYLDTDYFDFVFGDESKGERTIDAQYWSSTEYIGSVFGGQAAVFGVNFADGRIKGYPRDTGPGGAPMTEFVRYVRGNPSYGVNDFSDNSLTGSGQAGTITDLATALTWQKGDSGAGMNWEHALAYCEDLSLAGYDDWRLPNAKELQSIVDYARAPDAQNPAQGGPAIDPIFDISATESWFWTSTTLLEAPSQVGVGSQAVYLTFGQAFGVLSDSQGNSNLVNVHGAGAQRSDPKSGDPANWADGHGPQGDEIRIYNYARCVRGGAQHVEVSGSGTGEPATQPATGSQPSDAPDQGPMGGAPPQEAINACNGLSENAACQFTSPRGSVAGTCLTIQSQLACAPEGGPPGIVP